MRDKEILLALDAAEHLACELSFLEELLDASPASRVLITSRARLGLVSEEVLDIGGLPFPPDALIASPQPTVSELLLIERARRVCPRFATTIADAKAAARICHLLEGLPLALELAAEAARTHTAAEIAELLRSVTAAENVTWYLPGASAALDRSWLLLTSRARAVLAQLAVFPGSFSIDAANMVCALQDVHVCAPLLATLVEYSLLGRDQDGRYRMHLLMRQYAMTRLQREGDPTETKRRYRSYMLGFLSARTSGLVAGCPTPALEEVEREFDNISAAWEQAAAAEPTALAGALDALYLFCTIRGRSLDGDRLLRIALGAMSRPATDKDPALATVRARVAMRAALFKQALGQEREAQVLLEEGLAVLCSRLGRRTSPRPQGLEQPAGRIGQALSYRVDRRVVYSARGE
jgi:non-specific serine/threonine protein kinase